MLGSGLRLGSQTPWGPAQHVVPIAPGITLVSTAGHGGAHVDEERRAQMPQASLDWGAAWAHGWGEGWFEEDTCVLAVVLAFPDAFDVKKLPKALDFASRVAPADVRAFYGLGGA